MSGFVYFASPMCSWCWGFSPCVEKLQQDYSAESIRLVLTPFRADTAEPMNEQLRNYVLGQWRKVHAATSQPFDFNFSVPENFIYNTTLVAKAIKVFKRQLPENELDYVKALQFAFYVQNQDITDERMLIELANNFALDTEQFKKMLHSQDIDDELQEDFDLCQQLNIQSYPTLLYAKQNDFSLLSHGYLPYAELKQKVVSLLEH